MKYYFREYMDSECADSEKFEEDCWIAAPSQRDIGEYDIMERFTDTVPNQRAKELLSVSLEGKGAFRHFKDTLHRVGLTNEWYAFKRNAYIDLAKEWCEENDIPYKEITPETKPPQTAIDRSTLDWSSSRFRQK